MSFDFDIGVEPLPFIVGMVAVFAALWAYRRLRQVKPAEARAWVEAGAILLDVRSRKEFDAGHIDGAKNVPLPMLTADAAQVGSTAQRVVVYCASGTRSALATVVLKRAGFTQVADLGPMSRWQ